MNIYSFIIAILVFVYPQIGNSAQIPQTKEASQSIVPTNLWISDFEARLSLARILSHHHDTQEEALIQYEILLHEKPNSVELHIEMGRLYIALKRFKEGLNLLYSVLESNPHNLDLLVAIAQAEAAAGHAKQSQNFFLRALCVSKNKDTILIQYADSQMLWGSFYEAEEIYRQALKKDPDSLDISLKLGWSLASSQRYEEAEGVYRKLLLKLPENLKVLEALARLKMQEKDFEVALEYIQCLLTYSPKNPIYLKLQADTLFQSNCYDASIAVYDQLKTNPEYNVKAYIGIGRAYHDLNQNSEAMTAFEIAYALKPSDIEAQYYFANDMVNDENYISEIICHTHMPEELEEWANVYLQNGMSDQALEFYCATVELDSDYFPAWIGLAEMLSIRYQYDDALEIYCTLLEMFPENSKVMVAMARVLGWSKRYDESIASYNRIIALNPNDPVIFKEKARTAIWGKKIDIAMETYQELLFPSVDELLLESITSLGMELSEGQYSCFINDLVYSVMYGSTYQGYEEFSNAFTCFCCDFPCADRAYIEGILIDYLPNYLIQKSVSLEKKAKKLVWDKRYIHSLYSYRRLLTLNPGNEDALFDYAQSYCDLGLCNCSEEVYSEILNIDPNHNLAKMALERDRINSDISLKGYFSYWRELGSGSFSQSQIARYRFDTIIEKPLSCSSHLRFIQQEWVENPFYNFKFYPAEGQTIEGDCVFNEYVRGFTSVTYKNYFNKFKSRVTSHNNLLFNINDYLNVSLGCDKENEIYNFFSLQQGIQSISSWVLAKSNITHYWSLEGSFQNLHYNDHNNQTHVNLTTKYALTDDPTTFQIVLDGNYRNTADQSISIIVGTTLVDVIHPYWTPQDYFAGSITFECLHDYRKIEICESPQRYIDLKITGETDSVNNPSIQFVLEWKHGFDHFSFELKGLIHRSKQWNAEGAWGSCSYNF